jgi:hypothetical protein
MEGAAGADLEGRELANVRGEHLGKVDALLTYGDAEEPNWARAKLGRLGLHKAVIPLENAEEIDGKLCLPYETEHVQAAPDIDSDRDQLSDEQMDQLCRHYGLERVAPPSGIEDDNIELSREARDAKPPALEEGEDSPLNQRRRERMEELGVPDEGDGEVDSAEPTEEEDAPEPGSAEHEPESAMPEESGSEEKKSED